MQVKEEAPFRLAGRGADRKSAERLVMAVEGPYKYSRKLERRTASLFVQNTGRQQCGAGYGWGPGVRDHFLLHHILSGRGTCIIDSRKYTLEAGDSFLVYPDTTIHYYADASQPWEYIWVGFNGMDAERYVEMTDFSRQSPVLRGTNREAIAAHLEEIYRAYGTAVWENMAMTGRLYALLSCLVESAQRSRPIRRDTLDCAEAAADYIINHFAEPITVEQLADHFSVSHSSLYRKFMKRYQMSPKRFLLEYRIDRACILLSTTGHSVQEVSNSVGFDDPFYFSRVFKEIRGMSPRRYAAAHQGEEVREDIDP